MGIDPGTAVTGYGAVHRDRDARLSLVECGVIRTSPGEGLPARLLEIHEEVLAVIDRLEPVAVSVEDVFQNRNVRSALTLGHARGALLLAASLRGLQILEYTPREIKKAVVGTGNATKDQVAFMVARHLRLARPPTPMDASDGVAAALCPCLTGDFPG